MLRTKPDSKSGKKELSSVLEDAVKYWGAREVNDITDEYVIIKWLGGGCYGEVYSAQKKIGNEEYE